MKKLNLILITPIFILLSHYLAVFPHEYAHSFMAWLLGYKSNPFALTYGGTSITNILLLSNIDENVNYEMIYSLGYGGRVALIAFAGPGIANGLLFVLSIFLLKNKYVRKHVYLYYFMFWFNLMNLGNLYDYVPIRTFASNGDMANIEMGLDISAWWIYVIFGYLVAFLIWHFFTETLITTYIKLKLRNTAEKAALMIICVLILFGFFGGIIGFMLGDGLTGYGEISDFLTLTSFLAIPGIILCLWPTRLWVKRQLSTFK